MPWGQLYELVKPCYYEGALGNKPYDLELMLRIHLIQNLYDLSDEGTRNEIIDSRAFSDFCEVESSNQVPRLRFYTCTLESASYAIGIIIYETMYQERGYCWLTIPSKRAAALSVANAAEAFQ